MVNNKRAVHLHVEGVPNPNAMKIVLDNGILADKSYEYQSLGETENSPLARKLMMHRHVERVMINRNYVTILKKKEKSPPWNEILFELRAIIHQHLEADEPIMYIGSEPLKHRPSDDVVAEMIFDFMNKAVRPAAQEDGGDIIFESYEKGVLTVSMHGACHGCPYIRQTIKEGVETALLSFVPELREVRTL
ncbi:MAG: NifU family protein [Bacteroidota bacterium]